MRTYIKKGLSDAIKGLLPGRRSDQPEKGETMDKLDEFKQMRAELKPFLKAYAEENLTHNPRDESYMYICPFCGSGTGNNNKNTGGFQVKRNAKSFTCYVCNVHGDIIDLHQQITGLDKKEAEKDLCRKYGIAYPGEAGGTLPRPKPATPKPQKKPEEEKPKEKKDFTRVFEECLKNTESPDFIAYMESRGISKEIRERKRIGYNKDKRQVIIPCTTSFYVARNISPDAKRRYDNPAGASIELFNINAFKSKQQVIFVLEAAFDALSVLEVGGEAIGLNSTSNKEKFVKLLEEGKGKGKAFIICFDNDEPGQKAQAELEAELTAANLPFYRRDINGEYKDANERLIADREGLQRTVKGIIEEVEKLEGQKNTQGQESTLTEEEKKAEEEALKQMQNGKKPNSEYIDEFLGHITDFANTPETKTGFKCIDQALDGGLYEGLYSIGAISSLGKTSFVLQVCDQMAQAGEHILFFSMEMPRLELMAKSISRETFLKAEKTGNRRNAKDVRHIMNGKLARAYTEEEKELLQDAIVNYAKYAENIYIQEGVGDITVERIAQTVREHIKEHGKKPRIQQDEKPDDKKRERREKRQPEASRQRGHLKTEINAEKEDRSHARRRPESEDALGGTRRGKEQRRVR